MTPQYISKEHIQIIHGLLESSNFLAALDVGYKYQVPSNSEYLISKIHVFVDPNYEVSNDGK
jgi:hypothetical protein